MLHPLMGLSNRNKKWIADRLYDSIKNNDTSSAPSETDMILKSIKEGLDDIKEGRTFPAEDLYKHLDDVTD